MKSQWRNWFIAMSLVTAFVCIIMRLYMIQVKSTRSFSPAFSNQNLDLIELAQEKQTSGIVIDTGRGMIVDRNGVPFVGDKDWNLLVFPQSAKQIELRKESWSQLAEQIDYSLDKFFSLLSQLDEPLILPAKDGSKLSIRADQKLEIERLGIPGIYVIESDQRMMKSQIGQPLIGRVQRGAKLVALRYPEEVRNQRISLQSRIGTTGLEAAFEPFLHSEEESIILYKKGMTRKPLNGVQVKVKQKESGNEFPKHVIKTTLDKEIQHRVEQILEREQVKEGAVVVQEIATGNLLALGSRPNVSLTQSVDDEWKHRALMEATPGSIFKIVVAIAAINEGLVDPNQMFTCTGELGRYGLKDSNPKGHGRQSFHEAFADSCNVVLGQVAGKLGGRKLDQYAKQLGLSQPIIWSGPVFREANFKQYHEEQTGLIFDSETSPKDEGAVVQSGIGQRGVKMTPVQAANMVTALFHQGKAISPRLATEIQDEQGRVIFTFANKYLLQSKPLKKSTVQAVQKMMREVVTDGTATSVSNATWSLAGKTGTAQIGEDNRRYNKWMIGFGPTNQPRYSVAVVLRGVDNSEDPRAKRIFKLVMDELAIQEKEGKANKEKKR
ncbi:peptidoglycan D,D-transpeptidase FtsI family protein [Hazenella coriacea]|nr:penicillin-binding protein 2 [Hazenella coriacea]